MTEYVRPNLPHVVYYDEVGEPIPYGARWRGQSPPENSYSRVNDPERFAPLQLVAGALISWLQSTFEVETVDGHDAAADLLRPRDDITTAVRVTPRDPAGAPLTFVLTAYPETLLHAGALHDFLFPVCSCDACDESVEGLAEELEWTVRTVVAGGYSERFDRWPSQWIEYRLDDPGGRMRGGRSRTSDLPADRARFAKRALPSSGLWAPWPRRG